jgi:hypothetical protein
MALVTANVEWKDDGRMLNWKVTEGNGRGRIIEVLYRHIPGEIEGNHEKLQSG